MFNLIHFLIFSSLSYANEEELTRQNYQTERVCHFPESEERPFFIDIPSGPPPRSILLDTVVEPPDAKLEIANVRSNNLAQEQIRDWLSLEKRPNGQFLLFSNGIISQTSSTTSSTSSLKLPAYPSSINESLLYVTVRCNGRLYPLLTVRLLAHNLHAPEWWIHGMQVAEDSIAGEISIPKNSKTFGSLFDTQLLALDQEPSEHYPITFSVEPPLNKYFSIELANRSTSLPINEQIKFLTTLHSPYSNRIEDWHEQQQLPPQILIKLLDDNILFKEKEKELIINIIANDNGIPEERKSRIKLRFILISDEQEKTINNLENGKFSKSVYYGNYTKEMRSGTEIIPSEPINANFPLQRAGDRIIYDLDISSNPYAALFQIEPDSGRIRLVENLPEQPPPNIEMDILATLLPKNSNTNRQVIRTKLILTDRTEIKLTYFTQCHYLVHLAENPSAFTRILQFNFKGDVEGVELINGTELFKVDPYGSVSVLPGVDIDRERIERIVIKAKLKVNKSSLHPKSLELCQIATAEILIDDVNDHSPKFTQKVYRFRIDPFPYNNTEVGSLRAVDGDADEFGHLRYRILDEFVPDGHGGEEPLPFVLFQADGAATLFFVIKPMHLQLFQQPYKPQSEYTFTVEAYDSDEDPRTARVSVNVRIEEEKTIEKDFGEQNHHHHLTNNEQLLDEVKGERKHQRSAINEEIEEDINIPSKAWATRIRTVDKDVPPIVIRRQGKSSTIIDNSNTNSFKNNQKHHLHNKINFSQNNYIFRMSGNLYEGQTIGWVSSVKRMGEELVDSENQDENKEEEVEKEESLIEYAVEEGIDGFVGVDMFSGRLFVGPKLVGGAERFEEIRFSVAAMHPRDGRIWATALVSVIFDESNTNKPFFDHQQFNFEIDLSNLKHFPTFLGQLQAEIKTNLTELTEIPLIIYLIEEQKNEIKIIENKQKEVIEAIQISPSDLFSIGRESGKIHLMRKPTENELNKKEIKFKVFACFNSQIQKYQQQNLNNCAEALINVIFLSSELIENKQKRIENQTLQTFTTLLPSLTSSTISLNSFNQSINNQNNEILEFIPLPKNIFLAPTKAPGSTIINLSVRIHDPNDGNWHLISNGLGEDNQNNIPTNLNYWLEGEGESLFTIYGNSLILKYPLTPGQFDINLRARLQRKGRISVAEHKLRIIVIGDEIPQLYPVFEKISHEFNIDPEGRFPVVFPPLNASLAGGGSENIRFNLFPARINDPTDGIEIHPKTGQIRVRRSFLRHFPSGKGGEVFLVVRAINQALNDKQQKYFSDSSISIIIKPKIIPPLEFESTLYRYILSERQSAGNILENGPPIRIIEPNLHSNIRIRLATSPQSVWALKHFGLMPNGSLMLKEELDMERMPDNSQGLIKMEVVAEDISEGKEARAKVEIQLIDNNEHIPVFSPLFPKFYLQPETLFAGHPIGKLSVKDEDFTDRQGDTLAFRAISGNASHLIHVQRDGQLIVKDQDAALPGVYTLLVEVQDFGGLSARTTATFILSNFGEKFTSTQPDMGVDRGLVEERGTTVEFPLPPADLEGEEIKEQNTKIISSGGNNLAPIFSVRDSIDWEKMRKVDKNMSENLNFVLEENNYKGLFKMDKQSGQLFLEENTALDRQKIADEYELKVRVEEGEENEKVSNPRILLRRVYTVRLVPSSAVGVQSNNNNTSGTTKTNEVNNEESNTIPTIENSLSSTNSDNIIIKSTLFEEETLKTTTFSSPTSSFSESSTIEETTINELIEGTLTTNQQKENILTTNNLNNEEEFSHSSTLKVPSARPLELSSSFSTKTQEFITKIPTKTSTFPSKTFSTRQPFKTTEKINFALLRYHWLLNNPTNNVLVGKLDIIDNENKEEINKFEMIIEPSQFRQWFRVDSENGNLYLNEVPEGLYGRQRAEFRVNLIDHDLIIAETSVTVDLNLPVNENKNKEKNIENNQSTTTKTTLEISESSDQEATSLNEIDNIHRYTVSVSRFTSTTNQGERKEENEATEIPKFTQKSKGVEQQDLKFGSPEFRAMLPEGRYGNSGAQLTLRPYSLSTGMPKGIQYSIIDNEEINNNFGQSPLPFFVHSDSGDLIAFAEIDREEKSVYHFKVKAFDPSTNQNAETLVTVQILDVNDNFPHFLEPLIWTIPITRNTPYNTQLATFRAKDSDEGSHGRVHFKIEKDSSGGLFSIDGRTGQLFLAKNVPAENVDPRDQFEIIISALDGGRPSLRTEHHIRIEIFPEGNEFAAPEFLRSEYNAGNISGAAAQNGTFVFQVTAGISKQICYEIIEPPIAKLFVIDSNNGQIIMGRRPLDSERGHQWLLNISAYDCQQQEGGHQHGLHRAFTTVKVQLEQLPPEISGIIQTTTTIGIKEEIDSETNLKENCHFSQKVYNTEIMENTEGKQKLLNLNIIGNCENQQINCLLNQSNDAFELNDGINENNNKYCEIFVVQSLDREKKSLHFLVVNISFENVKSKAIVNEIKIDSSELTKNIKEKNEEIPKRLKRKNGINNRIRQNNLKENGREMAFNGLVEQIKAKLFDNQALIVIRVIDQNDNEPKINHLTSDGQIVFAVDWQTPVLQPIGRINVFDPDEQPKQLQFYLEGDNSNLFSINSSSGVIQLMKSLQAENSDEYYLRVSVSDGEHTIQTPITIYRLQPGTNIALLVINKSVDQIDVLNVVRHLNALLPSLDVDVLVKQVYIGENGLADPRRTHLLVYAQDKQTRIPLAATKLKELLESSLTQSVNGNSDTNSPIVPNFKISDSPLQFLASVQVPDYGVWSSTAPFRLNPTEIILLSVSAFLVFGICTMLFLLLRCCKRKQELITKSDLEYMVDSQIAGPRPYNVELITRKAMQNAQNATLRLPEPIEDCTMTPESRATMLASSGIYSGGGSLGGPLRRTNRVTTESSEEGTPPQFSRSNMSNEQLIRGQQLYGRNGDPEEPEYSPTIPRHQRLQNNYESGELSPETMRSEAEEINVSPPKECPPPPPSSSPPELNGK